MAISSSHPHVGSVQSQAAAHPVPGLAAIWLPVVDTCGRGRQGGCPTGLGPGYLETRELLWDWPEEEEDVAALSWEKPLVQDSRLDMEPLERKGGAQTLPSGEDTALGPAWSGGKAGHAVTEAPGLFSTRLVSAPGSEDKCREQKQVRP